MAKGFFNAFTEKAVADSAGTQPSKKIDSVAVQVMKEKNIDIGNSIPKMLTLSMNNGFDYIITMGCIDGCPITPRNKTIEWDIEDPKGKTSEVYRRIRDQIESNVKKLINEVI